MSKEKLTALFGHWIIAENINFHLQATLLSDPGFHLSTQHARRVWQSLIYVVVEGYRALDAHDAAVDNLLANDKLATKLRLFRNATFHYQEDPLSPKLWNFLGSAEGEGWLLELNSALYAFFERELPENSEMHEYVRRLRQHVQSKLHVH
jgi:hypothetical protein